MKKQLLLFLCAGFLCLSSLIAQETKKTPAGLGIDAGMGYNMMNLSGKTNSGNDTMVHYNRFWIQPCLRLHYDIRIRDFSGSRNSLKIKTFIGYYTFGGKSKKNDIGEYDIVSFSSIEAGAGLAFDLANMFQITPLVKAQYVITATERYIRETSIPASKINDITNLFSYNAGLQFRFRYKHFTVGIEGWYGLADIHKGTDKKAKENNFRLLIGYEF
ncbi:MAG TPA: outer membrane beta-barrel protein [Bacteroidales bacterium]|nr:outer membrane beta-barrel protein [Bacteroidales bacterium]